MTALIGLLVWPLAAVGALTAVAAVPTVGRVRERRKLARTRAHIAELERELGFDVPLEGRIDRELSRGPLWKAAVWGAPPPAPPPPVPVSEWVLGDCASCGRRVALNVGRCSGVSGKCAKVEWARSR